MIKLVYVFAFLFIGIGISNAQTEKIKGNRDVTIKQTYIDDFTSLIIKNDFEVKIIFNSKTSVVVEADDNLHDVINIQVIDGALTISAAQRITSKKKLLITINYSASLNNIELEADAELRSVTSLELENMSLKTIDNSRAYLNIRSKSFQFSSTGKAKSRLNVDTDSTSFIVSDNSQLDLVINSKFAIFDIYQRANITAVGYANDAQLRIDNSGEFSGKDCSIKTATLLIESASNATINVEEVLNLEASSTTETYVYGVPKININAFTGSAKLQKKEM